MGEEIEFKVALATGRLIFNWLVEHPDADSVSCLSSFTYFVLEAIYESKSRLDDDPPMHVFCTGCYRFLRVRTGIHGKQEKCPRCGYAMVQPETAGQN